MELVWSHNEERQRGPLRYSFGMETRSEEKTRSTKNNVEENGRGWKTNSWVVVMGDCQSPGSGSWWMEGECQSPIMRIMAWRDIDIDIIYLKLNQK